MKKKSKKQSPFTLYAHGDRSPEVVAAWNEYARESMRKRRAGNETVTQRLKDNAHTLHAQAVKRVKKAGGFVTEDKSEIKKIKDLYYTVCKLNELVGKKTYCVDHVCAVAHGGSHTLDNLQVLTISENSKKWHKEKSIRPLYKGQIETR